MFRFVALLLLMFLVVACSGGSVPTGTAGPTATATGTATPGATATAAGGLTPEQLCAFVPVSDWHQFNYVTSAEPDVTSDAPGTAICQYANTLFFEIYTHDTPDEAEATYETIKDNAPFDDTETVTISGADEAEIDMQIDEDSSGIVVRTGRVAFTVYGPDREEAREQLITIATSVIGRIAALR